MCGDRIPGRGCPHVRYTGHGRPTSPAINICTSLMCFAVQQAAASHSHRQVQRSHTDRGSPVRSSPVPTQECPGVGWKVKRKVVVGLARPDTRRSLPCHSPRWRQGRPCLECLTASRGSFLLDSAIPDRFPLPTHSLTRVAWDGRRWQLISPGCDLSTAAGRAGRLGRDGMDGH